jgi:hypothetical protein
MNHGKSIFSQIMDFLPKHKFRQCVNRYGGNYRVRSFTCFDQFMCMAFAQLTYRESLRDIECCLRTMNQKLYHMGIRGKVSRSTIYLVPILIVTVFPMKAMTLAPIAGRLDLQTMPIIMMSVVGSTRSSVN